MKKFLLTTIASVLIAGSVFAQQTARECVLIEGQGFANSLRRLFFAQLYPNALPQVGGRRRKRNWRKGL